MLLILLIDLNTLDFEVSFQFEARVANLIHKSDAHVSCASKVPLLSTTAIPVIIVKATA